ncbi:MAG: PD-(D/E)XK nuclease family protein [Rhodospirillales bacterium]|nr:PD-(D/E)XK nuclease family protein [Rhodospirillales bacterium]
MNTRGGLESLRQRQSPGKLSERDIDLLLCAELHAASPLRTRMAAIWKDRRPTFEKAWINHTEFDGESDLVIWFRGDQGDLVLLVENKITAEFQPDQAERYRARAERSSKDNDADVRTVLVCPKKYLSRHLTEAERFDELLTYEDIIDDLASSTDARSRFLAEVLKDGIEANRQGYTPVPNKLVTKIWDTIWKIAVSETPNLNMREPGEKPGNATWIDFPDAEGFSAADRKGLKLSLILKAEHGQADLQFGEMCPEKLKSILNELLEPGMSVEKAKKSASVRISVEKIDFGRTPEEQEKAIRKDLRQVERLRAFYVENRIGDRVRERL